MTRTPVSTQIWNNLEQILTLTTTPIFASLPLTVRRQLATNLGALHEKLESQMQRIHARARLQST